MFRKFEKIKKKISDKLQKNKLLRSLKFDIIYKKFLGKFEEMSKKY